MRDLSASPRAQRALTHRSIFREALTWTEIHGGSPEVIEHWKGVLVGEGQDPTAPVPGGEGEPPPQPARKRRRRRRRRGFRPAPQ